jgi:glycosyltransferase involved in cell wall biosynthesis
VSRASTLPLDRPLLSVIVPVYNERATFRTLMDQLIAKELPGIEKEIVIVESNSRDGTRDEVLAYRDCSGVQIVLQDRPRGKGHAVRAGLAAAGGHFIVIQDADLEYDLDDYDVLLKPLVSGQQAFVIGSRHSGSSWKMRQFNDAPVAASLFNLGHVIFLTLFNLLYAQRLQDPFSMFKVFRRECLYGLTFECNRFDFDFEIVIKLLRKGYRPIEIPVNYRARSFSEGKKVSAWRDPLTWVRALVKFRVTPLSIAIQPHTPAIQAEQRVPLHTLERV